MVGLSVAPQPAAAATQAECDFNPTSERCYSIRISNVFNYGAKHSVKVRDGLTYNPAEMFVISTMWVAMDSGWWVEAGYGEGIFACGSSTVPRWYSARYNASGYQETCINGAGNPAPGTDHTVSIERLSSPTTSWAVKIDGVTRLTHTSMKTSSSELHEGLEANHWATEMLDAWAWSNYHKTSTTTFSSTVWPNPSILLVGTPSASGYSDGYGVFHHGFDGV